MDISSTLGLYSKVTQFTRIKLTSDHLNSGQPSVPQEDKPIPEGQNSASEGCVNNEHNTQTDRVISPISYQQRHHSPHPQWLGTSHDGRPYLTHDLIQHAGDIEALRDAAGAPLWDSTWATVDPEELDIIHGRDQGRTPLLLPLPHFERTDAIHHNDNEIAPQRVNGDMSVWSSSGSSISTEYKFEENDTVATSESPGRSLAKQMKTPPPLPSSVPRTPFRSTLAKILWVPHRNKGVYSDSFVHPIRSSSLQVGLHTAHTTSANTRLRRLPSPKNLSISTM
ncbi:hypothetical protein S40285_10864 [Stachybotrys chlorohalonatus IBT 40285]|uniref:Uncharacterized protein n=1 Tax=Stachybotrys chlorohalonatus (strain IBT 40285) TaxID=1283841 RepID=A0A084QJU8_STAC4|nr:hypothetical protein S40285_10864 [Stachybotrys chlorohalonata IBT 40285]